MSTRHRAPRGGGGGLSLAFEDSSNNSPSSEKIQAAATATRIVHQFGGNDRAGGGAGTGRHVASSAPVNVPDWSKIYRIDSVESLHEMGNGGGGGFGGDDDHDDSSDEMVPPHEYLAREYARGRKSGGASVFEGVGRTLKGRDLRRVRDAVWSQTGFYG
ncbi:unnamed protein product [Linum tenue]|uniref:Senescence regulator n=1 Tax=Linum tenue TaxID=586396 RepID=A0AAV0PCG9_9ROSI|nr:unnamed protein product [Linum tenue]